MARHNYLSSENYFQLLISIELYRYQFIVKCFRITSSKSQLKNKLDLWFFVKVHIVLYSQHFFYSANILARHRILT